MDDATHLGRLIRTYRRMVELPQWRLAGAIGRSPAWLSNLEQGRVVASPEDLCRIASALHLPSKIFIRSDAA